MSSPVGVVDLSVDGASSAAPKRSRSGGASSAATKAPTPKELAATLAKLVGGGSVLLAMWIGLEEAAMEPEEAQSIADPAARLLARAQWAKRLTKSLGAGSDVIDLVLALSLYGLRVYPLVAAKLERDSHGHSPAPRAVRPTGTRSSDGGSTAGHVTGGDSIPGQYDPLETGFVVHAG